MNLGNEEIKVGDWFHAKNSFGRSLGTYKCTKVLNETIEADTTDYHGKFTIKNCIKVNKPTNIPEEDELTKKQIKLIAKIWVGSMAYFLDGAFNEEESGLKESTIEPMVSEARNMGVRILGGHPSMSDMREIVKYVKGL